MRNRSVCGLVVADWMNQQRSNRRTRRSETCKSWARLPLWISERQRYGTDLLPVSAIVPFRQVTGRGVLRNDEDAGRGHSGVLPGQEAMFKFGRRKGSHEEALSRQPQSRDLGCKSIMLTVPAETAEHVGHWWV